MNFDDLCRKMGWGPKTDRDGNVTWWTHKVMAINGNLTEAGTVAVLERLIPYDIEGGLTDGNEQVAIRTGSANSPWIVRDSFCTAVRDAALVSE